MKAHYKYRFYPTDEQKQQLAQTFGCVRYVYNWALHIREEHYKATGKNISYLELDKRLTELRKQKETLFLSDVLRTPLVQGLRHLHTAYNSFFCGYSNKPRFKKKMSRQSATYSGTAFKFEDKGQPSVKLGKQRKPLNIVWSRPLPSKPSSLTIIKESDDRYFVSFVVEINPKLLEKTNQVVGIDLGLKDIVVTSDGWKSGNPKYLRRSQKKLAREQKRLAKKQKGSANREKQRKKVARIHSRIADQRKDFLHKLSTDLVQRYDVICIETLAVKNMVKNHKLAQAISDAGWGMFVEMLRYKCEWYGKELVRIDTWYPSTKTCSSCGTVAGAISLDVRHWTCFRCEMYHDRDINAARVIEAVGMTVSACGEDVSLAGMEANLTEAGNVTSYI